PVFVEEPGLRRPLQVEQGVELGMGLGAAVFGLLHVLLDGRGLEQRDRRLQPRLRGAHPDRADQDVLLLVFRHRRPILRALRNAITMANTAPAQTNGMAIAAAGAHQVTCEPAASTSPTFPRGSTAPPGR